MAPPAVPPVMAADDAKRRKPAPKKPAAKKATPEKKTGKKRAATPEDGSNDSDSEDDESDGTKGKTTDEIRRQRRMLSNRESARRSRRRKLEHVAVLEGQIAAHKAENAQVMERLREMEQRAESAIRENAGLKAEVDRLTAALREAAAGAGSKAMERSSSLRAPRRGRSRRAPSATAPPRPRSAETTPRAVLCPSGRCSRTRTCSVCKLGRRRASRSSRARHFFFASRRRRTSNSSTHARAQAERSAARSPGMSIRRIDGRRAHARFISHRIVRRRRRIERRKCSNLGILAIL